jgi:hypothetical protein
MEAKQSFLGKYWKILLLLIVLITMVSYHFIKLGVVKSTYDQKIEEIKTDYELQSTSDKTAYCSSLTKVLSWAVKSEVERKNNENANIYLRNFAKTEFLVLQADLIEPVSGNINFSTNSSLINTKIELKEYDKVKKMEDGFYYIPITGDNYLLTILRIKFE